MGSLPLVKQSRRDGGQTLRVAFWIASPALTSGLLAMTHLLVWFLVHYPCSIRAKRAPLSIYHFQFAPKGQGARCANGK
ncbi:MAG: hypothetical protein LBT00_08690 [Spirochaetaceae bacterium]|nr:hypothetical protein [Spirochaetaceae bacterium]